MNLATNVFDIDYVAKVRSGQSITILEKKTPQNFRWKKNNQQKGQKPQKTTYRGWTMLLAESLDLFDFAGELGGDDFFQIL